MWTQKNIIIMENRVFAAIFNCLVISFRIFLHLFCWKWSFLCLLDPDPDPDPQSGSGSRDPIKSGSNPDPEHWLAISMQGCGSAFILCRSGSISFSECGSGFRSRSSLTKFEEKKSWRVFLSCKKPKRLLKSKTKWSLCKFTFKKLNKVAVISNFLTVF